MVCLLKWESFHQIDLISRIFLPLNSQPAPSKIQEVTDIIEWVQCFSVFTAIIHRSQPDCTPDLLGYQNFMAQTSLLCQEGRWVIYYRRFRLRASALRLQQWSTIYLINTVATSLPGYITRKAPLKLCDARCRLQTKILQKNEDH